SSPASMNDKAEIRTLEPYCHGQFTESVESPFEGRAHVHWLTGTASTCMVGCVEGILGMRPDFNGIRIAPSVPSDWKEFEISKDFRGKKLNIKVLNPNGAQSGYTKLTLNGEVMADNYIPADKLADTNDIILEM
ncbi:MAG: N,N'-diacetylchitobiose phosphorylase, partial [Lachnospiraceae bacterium]|nr:N,N'-diacetylchitobiose phosphorylase [Lachnospiraceae bacterium]